MTDIETHLPPPPKAPTPPGFASVSDIQKPSSMNGNSTVKTDAVTEVKQLLHNKVVLGLLGATTVVGLMLGGMLFGGSSSSKNNVPQGLQGVITNPEITRNLARCGLADRTAGCILYIMNTTRNDMLAEEFFDQAVQLTGRQKYLVTIENSNYAKIRISPGYLAQIKIPPLK